MPSNSQARYRAAILAGGTPDEDLPEWLKDQFIYRPATNAEAGWEAERWEGPGSQVVRDSQGNSVVLLDDDGGLPGNDLAFNDESNTGKRWDDDLGWVTDYTNVNDQPHERRSRRNQAIAATIVLGGAALGASGALGAASAGEAAGAAGASTAGGTTAAGTAGTFAPGTIGSGTTLTGTGLGTGGAIGTGTSLTGTGLTTGTGATLAGTAGGSSALIPGGAAAAGGSLAATVPGDIALSTGAPAGSTALVDMPGIVAANSSQVGGLGGWWDGLSPISRRVISGALSTGASALLQGMNQREQQQFIEEQEEQRRQDRIRRGQIPAFGSAFTRRPGQTTAVEQLGLIGSRRGG